MRALVWIALIASLIVILLFVAFAPRCIPGSGGIRIAGVVLIAGCPVQPHRPATALYARLHP